MEPPTQASESSLSSLFNRRDHDWERKWQSCLYEFRNSIDTSRTDRRYYEDMMEEATKLKEKWEATNGSICLYFGYPPKPRDVFDDIHDHLAQQIHLLAPDKRYLRSVEMDSSQSANGYDLYDLDDKFIDWADYDALIRDCWNTNVYSYDEFAERLGRTEDDDITSVLRMADCTGYGPEFDIEGDEDGIFRRNAKAMFALPYPHDLILHAAKMDTDWAPCVAIVNAICEWVRRKRIHMTAPH